MAVRTLVWVRATVRLAEAVELARVPVRPELVAVVFAPLCGVAVTRMAVPRGMLLARCLKHEAEKPPLCSLMRYQPWARLFAGKTILLVLNPHFRFER